MSLLMKARTNDADMPFKVVIVYSNGKEETDTYYNGKNSAIFNASKLADRIGEKVKVVYTPSNQVIWKNY